MRNNNIRWSVFGAAVLAYLGATAVTWWGFRAENPQACLTADCDLPAFEFESALFGISFVLLFVVGLALLLTRTLQNNNPPRREVNAYAIAALSIIVLTRALDGSELPSLSHFPTQWWVAIAGISLLAASAWAAVPQALLRSLMAAGAAGIAFIVPGFAPLAVGAAAPWVFGEERDPAVLGTLLSTVGWVVFVDEPQAGVATLGMAAAASVLTAALGPAVASASASRRQSEKRQARAWLRRSSVPSELESALPLPRPASPMARLRAGRS